MSDRIDELAGGYRAAQVLLAAVRLRVFDAVGAGEASSDEVAARLGADRRGTRILLDALAALGLVLKREGRYTNAPETAGALVATSPTTRVPELLHMARIYDRWRGVVDAVATGKPVSDDFIDPRLQGGARPFAAAMQAIGATSARLVADRLEREGARRLLDLGGGPGSYAIELARRWPGLEAWVLDRPETLEVTRENVAAAGLEGRVHCLPGDALQDELGGPYDVIWISNFVHIYSEDQGRDLALRSARALAPGGRLCIKDFLLEPDRTRPVWSALFAVNMLVSTEAGDGYTVEEVRSWCEAAGLDFETVIELTEQSRVAVARKPRPA